MLPPQGRRVGTLSLPAPSEVEGSQAEGHPLRKNIRASWSALGGPSREFDSPGA